MDKHTLGGYTSIDAFVEAKLNKYSNSKHDFEALFEQMFSEGQNTMFEESRGYRIKKTTYAQAKEEILLRARTLKELLNGEMKNSVVGIYMENSLDWIEMFWAVIISGFRPLLMNMRLDDETLEYALKTCKAVAVISDEKEFSVRTVKCADIVAAESKIDAVGFGTEIFVMSSGTSANVKICAYTAEKFYWQIKGSYSMIKKCKQVKKHYEGELKLLTFLPFYHIFGLVAVYIWFAFFSRTFVRLNDMQPQTILNTIKRHKVTHIFAVPLFWEKVC
ncbi:MAG: acyl--CoA ligase, partial [Ruminococcus sp.]|nr:acyl--CoA ligase [Ruminococcus sp.]